jgi:SulP family sulfate permease
MTSLEQQLAELPGMSPAQLRAKWRECWRRPAPDIGPDLLRRGIAWKLQSRVHGDLPSHVKRELERAAERLRRGEELISSSRPSLKDLLGLSAAVPADLVHGLPALWGARSQLNLTAFAVGIAAIAGIALLRHLWPSFPGSLLVIGIASALVARLPLPVDTIFSRFGELPSGLPVPSIPHLSIARISELLPSAFVIAFLAAVESLLSAIVADRMIGGSHRSGAELLAQGAANIASPLFGGLPATGAIARTATNVRAGGRTPVAGIVHAVTILIIMLAAASLAGYLAMPALAGLLIVTAWLMSEPSRWSERMRLRAGDRALFFMTMILTVVSNLTIAIAVGTGAGLALRLMRKDVEAHDWTPADRSKL